MYIRTVICPVCWYRSSCSTIFFHRNLNIFCIKICFIYYDCCFNISWIIRNTIYFLNRIIKCNGSCRCDIINHKSASIFQILLICRKIICRKLYSSIKLIITLQYWFWNCKSCSKFISMLRYLCTFNRCLQ